MSIGRLLRVITLCNAPTIWHATGTGSIPRCGIAAWLPRPCTTILKVLAEAITGPGLTARVPAG